jgi:hypothetical protein
MKKLILYLFSISILLITSCSDDSGGGTLTDPFGGGTGGTGGTGGVTFTISSTQGNQGGVIFTASPSVDIKVTKVTVSLPAQQFNDVLTDPGTTVFPANQAVLLGEYTGVATGQQWTFQFEGTLVSNNQAFNVTSNYTVP